jgi:antitoxin (DNA-binding transcriptional repressor) of toxin-antitoxin stability system
MIQATMFQAETRLSELVRKAQGGEKLIITSGRDKRPVAEISALDPSRERRLGVCHNPNFELPPDFNAPEEDEIRLWKRD